MVVALGYFMFYTLIKKKEKTDEKTYYSDFIFFGTLLIGSIFTGREPFDGSDISLIGGFSIFILSYFIAVFLSRKENS
ncbi:hypothetical protein [Listeria monocytogenes]|uniref:hypothetical protein n=1 Tax=Listeria monocytogenes TaxID=1639 RepID=UPI0021CD789B|nr:hypothetical protein [Listeria monocytogenes]